MYIPAVPLTPQNQEYIERQRATFLSGDRPPDFPKGKTELTFVGVATVNDVVGKAGTSGKKGPTDKNLYDQDRVDQI
jgi:hypothetical protein